MQVPRGSSLTGMGSQGLGGAEHPPRRVLVQPFSASRSPGEQGGRCWSIGWM